MTHTYKCGICGYTTERPGQLEAHAIERHPQAPTAGLSAAMLRDGQLADPVDLLADHIQALIEERQK